MNLCNESQPYIFISYAHKNAKTVVEIVNTMAANGYNLWYDSEIQLGTMWDDNIAMHIQQCSYFIAFVSKEYLASSNCSDELNYARTLDKNCFLIFLDDSPLPVGMAMRMNRIQSLYWNRYSKRNESEAYMQLFSADGINMCYVGNIIPHTVMDYSSNQYIASSQTVYAANQYNTGMQTTYGLAEGYVEPVMQTSAYDNRTGYIVWRDQFGQLCEYVVDNQPVMVGRNPSVCRIVIQRQEISGSHCSIEYNRDTAEFRITDMKSTNGTFLASGQRLQPHMPFCLRSGDHFYLSNSANTISLEVR